MARLAMAADGEERQLLSQFVCGNIREDAGRDLLIRLRGEVLEAGDFGTAGELSLLVTAAGQPGFWDGAPISIEVD